MSVKTIAARVVLSVVRVLVSALVWYLLLALLGVAALTYGVVLQWGLGPGLVVLGVLALIGSEMIRNGMTRA